MARIPEKQRLLRELRSTMGWIRSADSLMEGIGKTPPRNRSKEKRERLQRRRELEAEEEMKEVEK